MNMKRRSFLFALITLLLLLCCVPAAAADTAKAPKNKLVTENQVTYYYNKNGKMAKNQFVTLNKKTYFFDSQGQMKKNCLFTYKKKTYFAAKSGVIAKNKFVNFENKRYFFDTKGVRKTGWINWKNHRYYCPASGEIYRNCWKKIGSHTYFFKSTYYIARNTWVGDYYVNGNGYRTGGALKASEKKTTRNVIKMKNIKQNPELPTGCESVALTSVLKYYGFSLSKTTIASKYLPKSSTNFVTAFWGNPFSSSGGGIYSPGLTKTANKYLKAKKSSRTAYDITGTKFTDLYRYIDNGTPVIVWNSMYMGNPVPVYSYYCSGKNWTFYQLEHCVVLCGYDKKKGKVLINDPLSGLVWRNAGSFQRIYNKMGKMAVVIR